jgi:hypothetical protein
MAPHQDLRTRKFRSGGESHEVVREKVGKESIQPVRFKPKPKDDQADDESRDDSDLILVSQSSLASLETKEEVSDSRKEKPAKSRRIEILSKETLHKLHVELLEADRNRLLRKLATLKKTVESIQKHNAYERSTFAMKQRQLAVQIDCLQEDNAFLTEKKELLGQSLLELHWERITSFGKSRMPIVP